MGFAHRIGGFRGMLPRIAPRYLPESAAQVASNCRITSGNLEPLRAPGLVLQPALDGVDSFFRFHDIWLTWNRRVNVARAPIAGDTERRFYFTGDGEPRVSTYDLAAASTPHPASSYVLGVFPPTAAPGVGVAGGSDPPEDRSYLYTFVTQWGEESAPSPVSTLTSGPPDGTWTISGLQTAPANSFAVTAGSWGAGVATLSVADTRGLRVGETVNISGVNPAGFNGAKITITALTANSISYARPTNPGAWISDGTVERDAPHNVSGMRKRVYRLVTADSGQAEFRFVKEIDAADASTVDDGQPQETLPSLTWLMPPVDMHSLISLPNGIVCGISGNLVCFSEVNKPYAWPPGYQYAMDFNGIGTAVFGNTVVVPTAANPYVLTANDPATVNMQKIDVAWPCLSEASIASLGNGAGYSTRHGYVAITASGPMTLTEGLYTEVEWERLRPETVSAAPHGTRICIAHNRSLTGRELLIIGRGEDANVVQANVHAERLWQDPDTGNLYFTGNDGAIWQWDANAGEKLPVDWLSREFVLARPINLGVAKVDADFAMTPDEAALAEAARDAVIAANQALIAANATKGSLNAIAVGLLSVGGSLIKPLPVIVWDSLQFTLYVDGKSYYSVVVADARPFRLPATDKYDNFAVRCSGNVGVKSILVGETFKDLKSA